MIFLIHYDRSESKLLVLQEFGDDQRGVAAKTRIDLELSLIGVSGREVVILEAANLDALRQSHSRYFSSVDEMSPRDR